MENDPSLGRRVAPFLLAFATSAAFAQDPAAPPPLQDAESLADASLEELMNVEISSVSKRAERLSVAPAAVFVITAEDIRKSGARSLAEALRMAPGLSVAQIDAHNWAITSRGFNGPFANKLLVLIDGRAVYTPTFSGVYWDVQDVPLFDVERIEVVRGPGATLWGANAVNGVINVITKRADDTQGGVAYASVGTEQIGSGTVRYGGRIGDDLAWRVYGKGVAYDDTDLAGGGDDSDAWEKWQGGARFDWRASERDRLTFGADAYVGCLDQTNPIPDPNPPFFGSIAAETAKVSGWNVGVSWTREIDADESLTLAAYYDATRREQVLLDDYRDTLDLDFQHRFAPLEGHEVTWGAGWRLSADDYRNTYAISFAPASRNAQIFSLFVQDQIALVKDELKLTVGSKFEHNDFSGFEVQPSARLAWEVSEDVTLWGSVSRAVRTPSRADHHIRIIAGSGAGGPLGIVTSAILGSSDFRSEEVVAYEAGLKARPFDRLSVDLAVFYNDYDRLTTLEPGAPFPEVLPAPPHLLMPLFFDNRSEGEAYGFEAALDWRPSDDLRFVGTYSFVDLQLHAPTSGDPASSQAAEGETPEQQFSVRSAWTFAEDWDLSVVGYWVDRIPSQLDSYFRLDARLAWRPTDDVEVAVGVQNALDPRHREAAGSILSNPVEIERAAYFEVTVRF